MDKLVAIRIRHNDGTYSENIPLSVLAINIDWDDNHSLVDVLGNVDLNKGSIQEQINALMVTITTDKVQWDLTHTLSDVLGDVDLDKGDLQTQLNNIASGNIATDKTLTIDGKAADAKSVGDNFKNVVKVGNSNVTNSTSIILGEQGEEVTLLDQSDLIDINARIGAIEAHIDEIESLAYNDVDNLFKGDIKENGYYDASGNWIEDNVYKMAELPIGAVTSGDTLYYSENFPYYQQSYRFDVLQADGTWIKRYNVSQYTPVQITVDSSYGDFYVAMRIRTTQDHTKLIISKTPNLTKELSITALKQLVSPVSSKTINCLGDSFTAPDISWCGILARRTGCVCNNYGVSNSRISIDTSNTLSFLSRYNTMDTSADITIIFGGINDAASIKTHDIDLGDINSNLDTTTFYGALKLLITNIKLLMPGKKIIGVVPPDFAPNANYQNTLPLVQQACRDVYEYFSIPYCDLKKDCQEMYEDEYNNNTYRQAASDNWHPSALGHEAISEIIQGTLYKYINK